MNTIAIAVNVGAPPRGSAAQPALRLACQSMRGSFAWGGSPATATLTYAGTNAPVTAGARLDFTIGAHYFAGVCVSDTAVNGSSGTLRTLEFKDMRYFLTWDWVFGAFNMPDVRLIDGVRVKRYWHIYPADWNNQVKTYTTSPLPAWQILSVAFNAPTVFTPWEWDLTGNGLFTGGLLNGPIFEIDGNSGMRLDALLNLVCEKTGLVFTHDPQPGAGPVSGDNRLVFTRKGYGILPLPFPDNSDDQREGLTLTENPTNICVLGERNRYQFVNLPMVKDWKSAWEQFLDTDLLAQDLYQNETDPVSGNPYNAFPDDPDGWFGYGAAKARALEITVGDYVALRGDREGNADAPDFLDNRKFSGRWRNDMPAALYIQNLLFRAFKPDLTYFYNLTGAEVGLDSAPIADQLLCRVYLDYATGNMTADPTQPVDGNGVLAVQGYQISDDLFRLASPDRVNADFFSAGARGWGSVNFQIDDSGEGIRFVIADAPVFVSDNLLVTVNGYNVLNAAFTLQTPAVTAALVFEAERYTYWQGETGWFVNGRPVSTPDQPTPGRNRVEPVNGLNAEVVADWNNPAPMRQITYADGQLADQKAATVATALLLMQNYYLAGGYNLRWLPTADVGEFGTPIAPGTSSCIDRVEIQAGPDGVLEVVDFTAERQRDHFEPERELDRRTIQNSLFPGQQELRQQAGDQKRFTAGLRQINNANLMGLFQAILRGEPAGGLYYTRFTPGATLPATLPVGTPLIQQPGTNVATAPAAVTAAATNVFLGVTVRHNEPTGGNLPINKSGDGYAQVQGPVAANGSIGLSAAGGTDFSTNGAYLAANGTPAVGMALEPITDTSIKLIKVRLGAGGGGGGGGNVWL